MMYSRLRISSVGATIFAALGGKVGPHYPICPSAAYWNGRSSLGEKVASGLYFYTLQAGEFSATQKMVIMK